MSNTLAGLFIGVIIGVMIFFGGFTGFILTVVFGGLGLIGGLMVDGKIDLKQLMSKSSARR